MNSFVTQFFLSPQAGSREGKRGGAPLTAGPRPTRSYP